MAQQELVTHRLSRRSLLKRGVLLAGGGIALDGFGVEPRLMAVDKVRVPIAGLPTSFEGYKILHLTDTHCGRWIDPEFIRASIARGLEHNPDLVVFTGDVVDSHGPAKLPDLRHAFKEVAAPDGALLVLGNHDAYRGADRVRGAVQDQTPFELLENKNRILRRGNESIAIVGLGDMWTGSLDYDVAFRGLPKDVPRILLQHNPDLAEEMPEGHRVDLQLSGHTHGGQMRFPWGHAPRVPSKYGNKFLEGLVQGRVHPVFVCRGIGGGGPMHPRLFCPPQISVVELVGNG